MEFTVLFSEPVDTAAVRAALGTSFKGLRFELTFSEPTTQDQVRAAIESEAPGESPYRIVTLFEKVDAPGTMVVMTERIDLTRTDEQVVPLIEAALERALPVASVVWQPVGGELGVDLTKSVIQDAGQANTKLITAQILDVERDQSTVDRVEAVLRRAFPVEDISRRVISQQVSRELAQKGWQSVLLAMAGILIYMAWRFRLRNAVGAVVALIHDVAITLGIFALFQIEVDLAAIAAFLTIVGYSLNDTVIIYDRIRENLKVERRQPVFEIINHSVNQSLGRTLNTSITTLIPVVLLFLFGGSVLRGFSVAMLIGVVVGTYSPMYVANPILYAWTLRADKAKKGR